MAEFSVDRKGDWNWMMMIVQPDAVTPERLERAREEVRRKKRLPAVAKVRLERFEEGPCAQVLHLGPYSAEGPTIARLHAFIRELGHRFDGRHDKHHELYLGDPRRTAPERLKTIIRQPFSTPDPWPARAATPPRQPARRRCGAGAAMPGGANRPSSGRRARRTTRRVPAEALRELLQAPPRANLAFRSGDTVQAAPVAFRFQPGRYWIGVPQTQTGPLLGPGELVKLLIDDGRWFFQLRGLWVRGHTAAAGQPPDGAPGSLAWLELVPEKVVAWDYGSLREVSGDGP